VGLLALPVAALAGRHLIDCLTQRVLGHARASGALLVVAPPAMVLWLALVARAGRHFLTAYHHVGLAAMAQAAALLLLTLLVLLLALAAGWALARRLPAQPATLVRAVVPPVAWGSGSRRCWRCTGSSRAMCTAVADSSVASAFCANRNWTSAPWSCCLRS